MKNVFTDVAKREDVLSIMTEWREYLHQYPETGFEEVNTSRFIAENLLRWVMM